MNRWIGLPGVLLNTLWIMMPLQILTGTWSWPNPTTIPVSTQIASIAYIGIVAMVWNGFLFVVLAKERNQK